MDLDMEKERLEDQYGSCDRESGFVEKFRRDSEEYGGIRDVGPVLVDSARFE